MNIQRRVKRAVNLRIDAELADLAKSQGINLSQTLETHLHALLKAERERRWKEENREAIESYNRHIERNGIFGEEFQDL